MANFKGIAFPLQQTAVALPAPAVDDALIKQALVQIVMTAKKERIMRPDFGSGAFSYIFEDLNDDLVRLIRQTISACISKYEPRVLVQSIDVAREDTQVLIQINYIVIVTNSNQTVQLTLGSP